MKNINENWQLSEPVDAVVFDCDGTLSRIEGIDELARVNGVGPQVTSMTAVAMAESGLSVELYRQRLDLVQPTQKQVVDLTRSYFAARSEDAEAVVTLLQSIDKPVYIISAGVNPAVDLFGGLLGVPVDRIYAVDLEFDAAGRYLDFDRESPLVRKQGKREVIIRIKQQHPRLFFIGDGINDLEASDLVTRFVGYGGAYFRANIAECCEFYLRNPSLAAILPLILTETEHRTLIKPNHQNLYVKGLQSLQDSICSKVSNT